MEPTSENRPTLADAETKGAERLKKLTTLANRIAGGDILLQIGANAAKDRIDAAREKIETRATEIRDRVVEKISGAYDRFETKFNTAKDKTIAVGNEVIKRAKVVGLTPVAAGEAAWVRVYQIPAGFREATAEMKDKKIEKYQAKIKELRDKRDGDREAASKIREKAATKNSARRALDRIKTTG
jgi:uncharacterized coiled-coil DUF342 family protein